MDDKAHHAVDHRANAGGHEHRYKRQQDNADVGEIGIMRRALANTEEAGKNDANETKEFHGTAPVDLLHDHQAVRQSKTAADSGIAG
jgi:hypothetical protein